MMIGHEDMQPTLSAKSTPDWHKSPSLSSATTTDEDFLTGSPKTRWADLSEEDDDDKSEPSPFGFLVDEVKDTAPNSAAECAYETNMPHAGNEAHDSRSEIAHGSPLKIYECGQHDLTGCPAHDAGLYHDRKENRHSGRQNSFLSGGASPFTMLPPSFDSPGMAGHVAMAAPQIHQYAPPFAATKDTFTVTLSGIPPKLCNDACLDAILWASGVQRSALGYHTKKNGFVVINFSTSEAATQCYKHFMSCSWATGKLQVDLVLPNSPRKKTGNGRFEQEAQSFPSNRRLSGKHTRSSFPQSMW